MKENMRMRQNKTSQSIRKEDEYSANRIPEGPLWGSYETLWATDRVSVAPFAPV